MNQAGDGLMLLVASHELGDRERANLNAPPENGANSCVFLAPPPQPNPRRPAACLSFARSTRMGSGASDRGWLTPKPSARQHPRPARRLFAGCRHRAGLVASKNVAPGRLAAAHQSHTRQVIEALTHFGKACGEVSTARHETGLRPVDAPFHETSVTGLRPVGQDCSAATPGPSAYAALSSNAPSTVPVTLCPSPLPSTAKSSPSTLSCGPALLTHSSPLAPAADALEEDGSEECAAPARTNGPRGEPSPAALAARAFWPPGPFPPFLNVSPDAEPFPAGQAPPTARPSLHQHTEGHAWGNTSRHRRSSALDGVRLMAPSSLPACDLRQTLWLPPNKGLHPTRAARGRVKPGALGGCLSC
jgi:hypothetical protein